MKANTIFSLPLLDIPEGEVLGYFMRSDGLKKKILIMSFLS